MIEETAQVVAIEGNIAWVETARKSVCGSCQAKAGCGTGLMSEVLGRKRNRVRVLDPLGVQVGDAVTIGIDERALVRGSLSLYLVPLLGLLVGAFIGTQLGQAWSLAGEGLVILMAMVGLGAGFLWLRRFSQRIQHDPQYQPVILRRVL